VHALGPGHEQLHRTLGEVVEAEEAGRAATGDDCARAEVEQPGAQLRTPQGRRAAHAERSRPEAVEPAVADRRPEHVLTAAVRPQPSEGDDAVLACREVVDAIPVHAWDVGTSGPESEARRQPVKEFVRSRRTP
jgi:hypothetical protein